MTAAKPERVAAVSVHGATLKLFEFCAPDKWPDNAHQIVMELLTKCGEDARFIQDVVKGPACLTPLITCLKGGTKQAQKKAMELLTVTTREKQIGGSGGSREPPGPLLEPPGPLLTHLRTACMAYSECLLTRLNPPG
jgi:hypothetical protein